MSLVVVKAACSPRTDGFLRACLLYKIWDAKKKKGEMVIQILCLVEMKLKIYCLVTTHFLIFLNHSYQQYPKKILYDIPLTIPPTILLQVLTCTNNHQQSPTSRVRSWIFQWEVRLLTYHQLRYLAPNTPNSPLSTITGWMSQLKS